MNSKLTNRLNALQSTTPRSSAVELPVIPPGFTGTLIVSEQAQIWLPDNGRGPTDDPGPRVIRV